MTVKELKDFKGDRTADLARDLSEFEKNFILVTGGLLAFSITFIKDIVKIENAKFLDFLFIGWGLNVVSIGLMMYTWLYSSNSSHKLWNIADKFMIDNEFHEDSIELTINQWADLKNKINKYFLTAKKILATLRSIAVAVFLLGLVSLSFFVAKNLIRENQQKPITPDVSHYLLIEQDTLTVKDSLIIIKRK